jgi:hypothetical protein
MHLSPREARRSHPACLPVLPLHLRPRLGPRGFQFKEFFRFCNLNFGLLPNPVEMPATFRRSVTTPARIGRTSLVPAGGAALDPVAAPGCSIHKGQRPPVWRAVLAIWVGCGDRIWLTPNCGGAGSSALARQVMRLTKKRSSSVCQGTALLAWTKASNIKHTIGGGVLGEG